MSLKVDFKYIPDHVSVCCCPKFQKFQPNFQLCSFNKKKSIENHCKACQLKHISSNIILTAFFLGYLTAIRVIVKHR